MRFRRFSFPLSAVISILTAVMLLSGGLHFGIDFQGGTLMEIQARSGQADVGQIRQTAQGFGFGDVEVQEFGSAGEVSLRFPIQEGGEAAQAAVVQKARDTFSAEYDFRRVETVGPRVSGELVQSGTIGVVLSVIAVLFYLWFRFERELAMASIIGTLHDIVLTIGFFVITGHEFNMTSIAAILTIVGYSLNETVVVFDRTRELMRRYKTMPAEELLNLSINHTMSRTIMTAMTTALSLLALVLFGGQAIQGFAQVMLYGVVICTYSAIFISSPMLIYIGLRGSEAVKVPEGRAAAAE
nr:protein translocase subunit SecF [Microvirga splendida]